MQKKLNALLEQNDDLKDKLSDFNNDSKIQQIRQEVEQTYIDKLSEMDGKLREI